MALSRLDKIVLVKTDQFISNKIDLHALEESDLDKLVDIVNKKGRGFSFGVADNQIINQISGDQKRKATKEKGRGKFSGFNKNKAANTTKKGSIGEWS
jgi:hypothetical protein